MADHAVTWTALAYSALQDTAQSTEMPFRDEPTVTDDEIVWAIREAKALGLKVCLKPVVNVRATAPGAPTSASSTRTCRASRRWGEWFASYREFILHAAAHRRGRGLRDALHRLRDGARRRPRGASGAS